MPRKPTDEQLKKESALRDESRAENRALRIRCYGILKEYEEVFFRIFDRDIAQDTLFHACIFYGPPGSLKNEAAVLTAQSLVCPGVHGLINEAECDDPELMARVAENEYGDLFVMKETPKEKLGIAQATRMQSFLAKTAMEEADRKILIIDRADNMSEEAMNSVLKFLEEPAPHVYIILTAENIDRLLPTIRSRCMMVPFHPLPEEVYRETAISEGVDPEDAFLLTDCAKILNGYGALAAEETYQRAKAMFRQMIGVSGDPDMILVDYERLYRFREKTNNRNMRDLNMDTLVYFFSMLGTYWRNVIKGDESGPAWYSESVGKARSGRAEKAVEAFRIVREARDRTNRNNDLNLVLAQAVYRLEKLA